jgi:hypothetical protein
VSEEQKLNLKLMRAIGLALGALQVISISPDDFDPEGLVWVIEQLRETISEMESN